MQQITVNHDINNDKELERLSQLGLNIGQIMERGKLGEDKNIKKKSNLDHTCSNTPKRGARGEAHLRDLVP